MEQLDHLTSEQLVGKFSTVPNYAVLVGEKEMNYLYEEIFLLSQHFLGCLAWLEFTSGEKEIRQRQRKHY